RPSPAGGRGGSSSEPFPLPLAGEVRAERGVRDARPSGDPSPRPAPASGRGGQTLGSGDGNGGGTGGIGGGGGGGGSVDGAEILERIRAHRRYPELVRRRGVEGTVGLAFRVRGDGSVD